MKLSNWVIASIVVILVISFVTIIEAIINIDITFFKGWLSASGYFITISYLEDHQKSIHLKDVEIEILRDELDVQKMKSDLYDAKNRIEELNSQITTERCMKTKN